MTSAQDKYFADKVLTGKRDFSSLMMDIPGVLCKHGCSYMACRGLVLTPIRGMLIITHGPVGCSYYSWGGNRPRYQSQNSKQDYFAYSLSSRMEESDIVFGGEKKLKQAIKEAVDIFHPPAIAICTTCPIGLIGDDVRSIAEAAEQEYGIKVIPFSCEGFKSVPGYRLANIGIIENIIGSEQKALGKFPVNIIGEFYNGPKAKEISRIFEQLGYEIVAVLMGDGSYDGLKNAHQAKLNLLTSDKVVADLLDIMQDKFGTDWMRFNFIGLSNIRNSLQNIAHFFNDPKLINETEILLSEETARIKDNMDNYKIKLRNKVAVIYEDEFVTRHYAALFSDLDLSLIMVGNDLICREGQNEISFLSALESNNKAHIATSTVQYTTDLGKFHINLPANLYPKVKEKATITIANAQLDTSVYGYILISHLSQQEAEEILNAIEPDIFFPGILELFPGVRTNPLSCFFAADQYRFDYGGFGGALDFARDLLMSINMAKWQNNVAPWK